MSLQNISFITTISWQKLLLSTLIYYESLIL